MYSVKFWLLYGTAHFNYLVVDCLHLLRVKTESGSFLLNVHVNSVFPWDILDWDFMLLLHLPDGLAYLRPLAQGAQDSLIHLVDSFP
jgi:hypothetical protein